jgi:GntR family transcriptional repressor for pyruvate dehydrogenase complex
MGGNMLKAVEKKRAYEDIVKQIRDLIEKGKLKKGDQLPTERELTDTFKVSRATVREAIRTLESIRLVESRQGNGTYVLASSEEALVQPLAAALFHGKDDIMDIFHIRRIIEPYVAQLAAQNATREEIRELGEIIQEQEKDLANGKNIIRTDSEFHNLLARMSKKRVLERLLLALVDLLSQTREEYLQNDMRARESLKGHQEVLAAIKIGDCAAARKAMLHHLDNVQGLLFRRRKGGGRCE